jgi:DNA modification methylase
MTYQLFVGNNLEILPTLPDNSIDSIVTDPPYGLSDNKFVADTIARWIAGERDFVPDGKGFMGKAWDAFVPPPALWDECLRVLKPGGHLLAFFGSRTQDIGALAIRLAGFEIRDSIAWLYGSGFPKSMDISKAIDKAAGAEREVIGTKITGNARTDEGWSGGQIQVNETAPATPEAQQWQGWGTALKPALEPIVVARKPIEGTVANNVLKWGTGGLNIDGSRIGTRDKDESGWAKTGSKASDNVALGKQYDREPISEVGLGRWPANIILDLYTAELLDEQSGQTASKATIRPANSTGRSGGIMGATVERSDVGQPMGHSDSGGASRFFYVAKASKRDRNEGLDELGETIVGSYAGNVANKGNKIGAEPDKPNQPAQNFHPTVKPTALMEYLVKLVTPPNGTVLDPFTGSGSTGKAAILQGFNFIGIEMTEEYVPIIEGRLKHAEAKVAEAKENQEAQPQGLF